MPTACASIASPALPKRKPCILLVEDDEDDFRLFEMALLRSKYPFEVVWMKNGEEAKGYLKTKTAPFPDLIVTDIKMPGTNGFNLLGWARENSSASKIPWVILSSSNEFSDRARGKALGVNAYHVKNGDPKITRATVEQIWEHFFPASQS